MKKLEPLISMLTDLKNKDESNTINFKSIMTKKYSNSYFRVRRCDKPIIRF